MEPQLLTTAEAAKLFQAAGLTDISEKWLSDQIDRGKVPTVVVARKRRVRSDIINAMIDSWFEAAGGGRDLPRSVPKKSARSIRIIAPAVEIDMPRMSKEEFFERFFAT